MMRSNSRDAIQLMECLERLETEKHVADVKVPTLLVHGSRDVITPIQNSEHLQSAIRGSRLVRLDGAGHVPTLTRPADVAAAIESCFLSRDA